VIGRKLDEIFGQIKGQSIGILRRSDPASGIILAEECFAYTGQYLTVHSKPGLAVDFLEIVAPTHQLRLDPPRPIDAVPSLLA
jgi:hypothetical protein